MAGPGLYSVPFEQQFPFQTLDAGEVRQQRSFGVIDFNTTGNQNLAAPFNLQYNIIVPGSDTQSFSLNPANGEITINNTDVYTITYDFSLFELGGTTQVILGVLQQDSGGGFANVIGTTATMTFQTGADTSSRTFVINLSAGDIIRVNISQFAGTNSAATIQSGSSLTIESLKDETQDQNYNIDAGEFGVNEEEQESFIDAGDL